MKNSLIVLAVICLLGAGVVALHRASGPEGPQGNQGLQGPGGTSGADGKNGTDGSNGVTVGAVSGPDSYFPCETHNGVTSCFSRVALRQASTTLAIIKSPGASTTVSSAACNIASGNVYANDYQLGWSTIPGATTTHMARLTMAAGGSNTVIATTTLTGSFGGGNDGVIPPNTYISFRVSTSTASATYAPVGSCAVIFRGF